MKTKYFKCTPILKQALCDNCGAILRYVRSDFSRGALSWLHACDRCGKEYWLDNRYPYADYLCQTNQPLDIATDPISGEEAK
jgi:uncharacterized protein with PIN domain